MAPEFYLSLLTLHGTIMVFFVLTLAPLNAFGNLVLPEQLGARGMAFPRLNLASFWIARFLRRAHRFVSRGRRRTAFRLDRIPSAERRRRDFGAGRRARPDALVLQHRAFLDGVAAHCDQHDRDGDRRTRSRHDVDAHAAPGWNWFVTAILSLLSFSVLIAALLLILLDRLGGTSFFVPAGLLVGDEAIQHSGGSPLLWQHLFWFFGHPEVYIAILPGMGIVSHLISNFSRKPVFGYRAMVWASISIAFLGLLVWGHHMFISGLNPCSAIAFSFLTMVIGAPSAVKTFNWIATAWNGSLRLTTAMLFSLGFVSIFVTGGLSGLFLGQPEIDAYFHDTYFVVAHFHLIMGIAALFGIFAATFYWFPLMFGRMMDERLGKLHFYLTFIGAYATFLPMHFAGFRRKPTPLCGLHYVRLSRAGNASAAMDHLLGFRAAAAQVIFLWNLFRSMRRGAIAPKNPWQATSLEWSD